MSNLSQWSKSVRKAIIDKETTMKDVASHIGCRPQVLSALINGKPISSDFDTLVNKVNDLLGTTGYPPKPVLPSEEWQKEVRKAMVDRDMTMNQLSATLGVKRDRISLIVNGHSYNDEIIGAINELLNVSVPVISATT